MGWKWHWSFFWTIFGSSGMEVMHPSLLCFISRQPWNHWQWYPSEHALRIRLKDHLNSNDAQLYISAPTKKCHLCIIKCFPNLMLSLCVGLQPPLFQWEWRESPPNTFKESGWQKCTVLYIEISNGIANFLWTKVPLSQTIVRTGSHFQLLWMEMKNEVFYDLVSTLFLSGNHSFPKSKLAFSYVALLCKPEKKAIIFNRGFLCILKLPLI